MASDPNFSHHNVKLEATEASVQQDTSNITSASKLSSFAEFFGSREVKCTECGAEVSEESFTEHSLVCSKKENTPNGVNNDSQIFTSKESPIEVIEKMESPDSKHSNLSQQSLSVSREIDYHENASVNSYYTNHSYSHDGSEDSNSNEGPNASEDNKSDENSANELLLQDTTYSCSICSFTTDREQRLDDHERIHKKSTVPILNCVYCNQKYIKKDLLLHVAKVHPGQKLQGIDEAGLTIDLGEPFQKSKSSLQCSKCRYIAKSKSLFVAHLERHKFKETGTIIKNEDGDWQCDKCSYSTKALCDLQKHRNGHEYWPTQCCPWCDFKSTKRNLYLHKAKCTRKPKNVPVKVKSNPPVRNGIKRVGEKLHSPVSNDIKQVEEKSNPPVTNDMEQDLLKCTSCSFSTDSQIKLKSHVQNKHTLLKCPHCSIAIKNSFNFQKHLKLHKIYLHNTKCTTCEFEGPLPTLRAHCLQKNHNYNKYNNNMERIKSNVREENDSSKKDKEIAVDHVELEQHQNYAYKCYTCSFSAIKRNFLKVHLKNHRQKQPINKCPECDYRSTTQSLKVHVLACHKAEELDIDHKVGQCFVCSAIFTKNELYQKHWKMHITGFPTIECKHCDFKSTPSIMVSHRRQCKGNIGNSATSETIECKHCDFKSTPSIMVSHRRQCKGNIENSATSKINESKVSESEKNEENAAEEENTKHMQNENYERFLIQCNLCDAKIYKSSLTSHLKSHSRCPMQKCHQCNFKSTTFYLETHIRKTGHYSSRWSNLKDKASKVQCNLCDAMLPSGHLKRHIASHSAMKLKKCRHCSFKSTAKFMQTHIRETGHYTRILLQNKIVKTHKRTTLKNPLVNETKTGQEKNCFKDNSAASEKISNEKSVNAFQCSSCSFSTNLRFKLNMHKKKKHLDSINNKNILNCRICSWTTQNDQLLQDHLNAHYTCNKPVMQCAYCSFKGTPNEIKYHEQCTVPKPENRTKANVKVLFKCTQSKSCTFTTYLPNELKNHKHLKAIKCDSCSFSSFFQYKVDMHLLSHTKFDMPVENCSNCDFRSTPTALAAHKNKCLKRQNNEASLDESLKKRRKTNKKEA